MQRKRKRDKADEGKEHRPPPSAPSKAPTPNNIEDSDTELNHMVSIISFEFLKEILLVRWRIIQQKVPVIFKDKNATLSHLKRVFETSDRIFFHACYDLPADPLTPERDIVKITANEIWKVSGYRFR